MTQRYVLGVHAGIHDAAAALYDGYDLVAAVAQERMTRIKTDGGRMPDEAIAECLAIAGIEAGDIDAVAMSRGVLPSALFTHLSPGRRIEATIRRIAGREKHKHIDRESVRAAEPESARLIDMDGVRRLLTVRPDTPISLYNHHEAHALPCLFHTDWDEALLYTTDGGGDNTHYSMRLFRDGQITDLYGTEASYLAPRRIDSLGRAYGAVTAALGWTRNRHEGKVTGLAALGEPSLYDEMAARFRVDEKGEIWSDFSDYKPMEAWMRECAARVSREDLSASVQKLLEETTLTSLRILLDRTGAKRIGMSGGVVANVRLNQRIAEELGLEEIFVYPAMGDQGLAAGGVLCHLLQRDGLAHWLERRKRFDTLYLGRDYTTQIDRLFEGSPDIARCAGAPADTAADMIADGRAVAIYTDRMEHGPRALGARSILASPANNTINDSLNARLSRSEFMPFAPYVAEEDASRIFEITPVNAYAARFMTVTCHVRPEWRPRIPAVTHVDGTARPQIIRRADNPLYYDILKAFERRTGLPVLINTSFNAHEEPIIDTPEQCLRALRDDRIDAVATAGGVWRRVDQSPK